MFIPTYDLHFKKNMDLLKSMPDNSLDAGVMDCPYGFGKEPNAVETLQAWITTGYHEISGAGFMGKKWDSFVPQPIFWKEVYRVLKPGGFVLAFFGTRTYDWGTMAIRLAGFEIRDCIQWIYGSGFPKSLDISKAIDKGAGLTIATDYIPDKTNQIFGKGKGKAAGVDRTPGVNLSHSPVTEDAKTWEGYGTGLKPSNEPICVARKPLAGTYAENVLTHHCGALNLAGCKIEYQSKEDLDSATWGRGTDILSGNYVGGYKPTGETNIEADPAGRWPANVIFDEEAAAVLDQQTGVLTSGANNFRQTGNNGAAYGKESRPAGSEMVSYGDSGGASRFFYCAKASKEDRNYGCEGLALKDPACVTDFRPSLKRNPENWANGTEGPHMRTTPKANNHPTVKPIALMRYLCKLVKTPFESCTIADFFMGSGTTGIACMLEGINFIGCDDDEDSFVISSHRIPYAQKDYEKQQAKPKQVSLFIAPEVKKVNSIIQQTFF